MGPRRFPPKSSAENITGLDHHVLTVADIAASAEFYERLGKRRGIFDGDRVALHFGHQKINLHQGLAAQPSMACGG